MDRIVRSRPDTSFFLATDSEETQRRFQERYGSRILTNTEKRFVPSIPDAPKANQHDAVVDDVDDVRTLTAGDESRGAADGAERPDGRVDAAGDHRSGANEELLRPGHGPMLRKRWR